MAAVVVVFSWGGKQGPVLRTSAHQAPLTAKEAFSTYGQYGCPPRQGQARGRSGGSLKSTLTRQPEGQHGQGFTVPG